MLNQLAPREQEVFLLLAHGEDNATIASTLSLSEGTVRNYVSRIYQTYCRRWGGVPRKDATKQWHGHRSRDLCDREHT